MDAVAEGRRAPWRPSVGWLAGLLIVTAGVLLELQPLHDNSFLTHLATGRLILDRGRVPSVDPYSFTAAGEPWVVQSWLVSVGYAFVERLGGLDAVRLLSGLLAGTTAGLGWRLLRPADGLVARLGVAALFVTIGAGQWAERPFMVGLIALAVTVLAAEGGCDPRWLVPLGWIWVNSHGSFPLGLLYLVVAGVGSRLDGGTWDRELRCLRWAALGTAIGVIGPLGLRVLTFPVELLSQQDVLRHVVEWQSPSFTSASERAFLVQVVLAVVLLARRPSYRAALVTGVFVAAALLGSRNIVVASIVLLPSMAAGLAGLGSLATATRPARGVLLAGAGSVVALLLVVGRLQGTTLDLTAYPVDAVAYLEHEGIDTREVRMAGNVVVGNLLTYLYGPQGRVFYDDRFDMYPADITEVDLALEDAQPSVFAGLERLDVDLVLLSHLEPLALVLARDPAWRVLYTDEGWQLACRRGADLGPSDC
jgi:hypothetical protein